MDWSILIWLAIILAVGLISANWGRSIVLKSQTGGNNEKIIELSRLVSYHRWQYLSVLQRELSNYLINHDPDRFSSLYKDMLLELKQLKDVPPDQLENKLARITKKYPQYSDFDWIGTKEYILYKDGVFNDIEKIEEFYRDILTFQEIQSKIEIFWPSLDITSDGVQGLIHFEKYIESVKDSNFKDKLRAAKTLYFEFARSPGDDRGHIWPYAPHFETDSYVIDSISNHVVRLAIYLKNEQQYGIYEYFLSDEGKKHEHYYRSNKDFESVRSLDSL